MNEELFTLAELNILHLFIIALAGLTLGCVWWSVRSGSVILSVLARWLRWVFIAFAGAILLDWTNWTPYPTSVLIPVIFLGWFLLETIYNWIAINAISRSGLPLFPRFKKSNRKDFWPKDIPFLLLKDWLRENGFKKVEFLTGHAEEHEMMRLLVYDQENSHLRFNLILLPGVQGLGAACYSFTSIDVGGVRCITDNIFLPYGGFYPENWKVERHPCLRQAEQLYQRHLQRLDAIQLRSVSFSQDPEDSFNRDRIALEQLNYKMGFFASDDKVDEEGRITTAGRYRIWQEIWMLGYLGRTLQY